MTSRTDVRLIIKLEAMERGNLVGGTYNIPRRKYNYTLPARYNSLPIDQAMGDSSFYNDDASRRIALFFDADQGGTWAGKLYTGAAGGHTWDGGHPDSSIDLIDYPYGVFQASQLTEETLTRAACYTGVIVPPVLTLDPAAGSPTGSAFYINGELESDLDSWPGRVQTG